MVIEASLWPLRISIERECEEEGKSGAVTLVRDAIAPSLPFTTSLLLAFRYFVATIIIHHIAHLIPLAPHYSASHTPTPTSPAPSTPSTSIRPMIEVFHDDVSHAPLCALADTLTSYLPEDKQLNSLTTPTPEHLRAVSTKRTR